MKEGGGVVKLIFINGLLLPTGTGVEETTAMFGAPARESSRCLFVPDALGIKVRRIDIVDLEFDSHCRKAWDGVAQNHGDGKLYRLRETTFDPS